MIEIYFLTIIFLLFYHMLEIKWFLLSLMTNILNQIEIGYRAHHIFFNYAN